MPTTVKDLIPMLQNLIRDARATPTQEDLDLLVQTDVKEMRIFFDALSSGRSERDTYAEIIAYVRGRYGAEKEAEERKRREAEEAERKKREEEERKKREAEEAERKRREAEEE
eukprot:CAMPEP_0174857426 /NCGR_PEP_ID=MMETSP1114-20130205/38892_1 /TAXON_ID=312471 /ORGANISM="Neobodo designis, Strain CCAP 1951/1" /LENGTH=112 /DNA_ID=CAMNT_0016092275 /DNA_START=55 /DNA_END=390 /DNA_ORIENTATION=+